MSNWRPQNSIYWWPNNGIQRSLYLCLKICLESNQVLRTQILLLCCHWPGCLWQLVEWDTSLFAYKHTKKRPLPQTGTHHYRNSEDPATGMISLRSNSPTLFHFCVISSVRSSYSHPGLLVITSTSTTPLFQITPVLNTGLSLSEPLQLYKGYNAI